MAVCYDQAQLAVIAKGLNDLELCRKTLALREQFIEEAKINPPPESAWWQEPQMVVGGVVISFAVGSIVGALVMAKK